MERVQYVVLFLLLTHKIDCYILSLIIIVHCFWNNTGVIYGSIQQGFGKTAGKTRGGAEGNTGFYMYSALVRAAMELAVIYPAQETRIKIPHSLQVEQAGYSTHIAPTPKIVKY